MARKISVSLAELAKPITVKKINAGTTLVDFLEDLNMEYSSSVRVNAKASKKSYKLKSGDIVSIIGAVSGGLL